MNHSNEKKIVLPDGTIAARNTSFEDFLERQELFLHVKRRHRDELAREFLEAKRKDCTFSPQLSKGSILLSQRYGSLLYSREASGPSLAVLANMEYIDENGAQRNRSVAHYTDSSKVRLCGTLSRRSTDCTAGPTTSSHPIRLQRDAGDSVRAAFSSQEEEATRRASPACSPPLVAAGTVLPMRKIRTLSSLDHPFSECSGTPDREGEDGEPFLGLSLSPLVEDNSTFEDTSRNTVLLRALGLDDLFRIDPWEDLVLPQFDAPRAGIESNERRDRDKAPPSRVSVLAASSPTFSSIPGPNKRCSHSIRHRSESELSLADTPYEEALHTALMQWWDTLVRRKESSGSSSRVPASNEPLAAGLTSSHTSLASALAATPFEGRAHQYSTLNHVLRALNYLLAQASSNDSMAAYFLYLTLQSTKAASSAQRAFDPPAVSNLWEVHLYLQPVSSPLPTRIGAYPLLFALHSKSSKEEDQRITFHQYVRLFHWVHQCYHSKSVKIYHQLR